MKIDDAIIDKVLNNKASAEDAKAVSEWLATEEGHDYLSKRIDREVSSLTENEVEDWVPHVIPEEKMQQRFLQQITLRRRVNSYRRWWAAAVLISFIFLCGSVWFLADKVGLFSETEYAELVVPCGEQMRVVLQDGTIVQLNSDTRLKYPKKFGIFNRTVELWGEGYFGRLYKDFLLAGTLHDFVRIQLSVDADTEEALREYEDCIRAGCL